MSFKSYNPMLLHLHEFLYDLPETEQLALAFGIFSNFSMFLLKTKLRTSVFQTIWDTLSSILSPTELYCVFIHVILVNTMVSVVSSICYRYPITFIFFSQTTLQLFAFSWWSRTILPVIIFIVISYIETFNSHVV